MMEKRQKTMEKINISLKSSDDFFGKIEKISKAQRIFIYCASMTLLIGLFAYFIYLPRMKIIKGLNKEYQQWEEKLVSARNKAAQLNKYRAEMKKAELQFREAKEALPEKNEIPALLTSISQSGQDVGLEFLLFQPKSEINKGFYAEIPVSIKVTGSYQNVVFFLDKIASLSRIVNVMDIKISPSKDNKTSGKVNKLITECTAVTYKFVEASSKKVSTNKKQKRS